MRMEDVMRVIEEYKSGTWVSITWEKELKTRKGIEAIVTKKTEAVLRMGVAYDNKASVKEKRESGELPEENQGLPYGIWHLFPYLIQHKENFQLRVTTSQNTKYDTHYFLNGTEVKKDDIRELVLKSEIESNGERPEVFNIKIENLVAIK
jgi:hypothetical protein